MAESGKDVPRDWFKGAEPVRPRKVPVTLRVDPDVLEWFRSEGRGWQTRMNAALRAYVTAVQASKRKRRP